MKDKTTEQKLKRLTKLAWNFLNRIDSMTIDQFQRGKDAKEREALRRELQSISG